MKKFLVVLCCLLVPIALTAQQRTGNISGTVVDNEGTPLPGVSLTLTGETISAIPATTNAEGKFRFLSLFPANDYVIRAELAGFKTKIEEGIIVNVAKTSDIVVTMEVGALEEQVTVVAVTPVVEAKKTQITHTINYQMLQELPSARDPWVMLQLTPSVLIDRENIGGVESGQQSSYAAKGTTTQEWTVDGMQITDRNSGGSPGYYNFDAFEEMNVSTGMLDVEHRDPSIVVNLVSRRGGNRTSLGGRFYYTNDQFQANIPQSRLDEFGVSGYNRANDIKDFGFNAGGPLVRDKVWWWFGYGVQQIKTFNTVNTADDTYLTNYTGKINLQLIPQNRFEIFFQAGKKEKFGRSSSVTYPPGWNQGSKAYFGNPTIKIQDEHMFGDDLFLSIRIGKSNAGFGMWPADDMNLTQIPHYDVDADMWGPYDWFYSDRPHPYSVFQAQYFNDNLAGTAHEVKIGFEINNNARTYVGGYAGNMRYNSNYYYDIVDWDGDGVMDTPRDDFGIDLRRFYIMKNDLEYNDGGKRWAAYFSDVVTIGRLNLNLGFRLDRWKDYKEALITRGIHQEVHPNKYFANYVDIAQDNIDADTIPLLAALLPDGGRDGVEAQKLFVNFSPRLGLTYDIFGDGRTIFKAGFALYRGSGLSDSYWTPYGVYGNINFYWWDEDGNGKVGFREAYWADYSDSNRPTYRIFDDDGNFVGNYEREEGLHWGSMTWGQNVTSPSRDFVDLTGEFHPNGKPYTPSKTYEVTVGVEREIFQDFGVSGSFTWKREGNFAWDRDYYPETGHIRATSDYVVAGVVPDTLYAPGPDGLYGTGDDIAFDPGEGGGREWYVQELGENTAYTSYDMLAMYPDVGARRNIYKGFDLVFNKRLSNKWMFNGSVTLQMDRRYYGLVNYGNPTNRWVNDGKINAPSLGGGSGKISRYNFSRWMVKLMGLYQLPWDINISGTFSAHEGSFYYTRASIQDRTLPNPRSYSASIYTTDYDNRDRLPDVFVANVKIEKMLKLGQTGRMYLSADLFNVFNSDTVLRKRDVSMGTFRFTGTGEGDPQPYRYYAPSASSGAINEIMNPLILRIGVRFQI